MCNVAAARGLQHTAPVVHEDEAEDVLVRVGDRDRAAQLVARADKERDLELIVEELARAKNGGLA
jgi:hypothetical protein